MFLKETRRIDTDNVRSLCIRQDYYTRGTNEEYCKMFDMCKAGFGILAIASDILEHSNKERLMRQSGCSEKEVLENICFELINDCTYTTVSIEE